MEESTILWHRLNEKVEEVAEQIKSQLVSNLQPLLIWSATIIGFVGKKSLEVLWILIKLSILLSFTFVTSAMFYAFVYWLIMPQMVHRADLYFDYGDRTSAADPQDRSLPVAKTDLFSKFISWEATNLTVAPSTTSSSLLVPYQSYELWVEIDVPESPMNVDVGIFMVRLELLNTKGELLARCSRSALIRYTPTVLKVLRTIFFAVPMILGWTTHSQMLQLRCFEGFVESKKEPLRFVRVILSHPNVQVYSASLRIHALLGGIKYYMYHWWICGALIVITQLMAVQIVFWVIVWIYISSKFAGSSDSVGSDINNGDDFTSMNHYRSPLPLPEFVGEPLSPTSINTGLLARKIDGRAPLDTTAESEYADAELARLADDEKIDLNGDSIPVRGASMLAGLARGDGRPVELSSLSGESHSVEESSSLRRRVVNRPPGGGDDI